MEDTLVVKNVGFGTFKSDDGDQIKYANVEALDEISTDKMKAGLISAKYDIINEEGKPNLELAESIQTKFLSILQKSGDLKPVEMKFTIGFVRRNGKKVMAITGIK